MERVSRAAYAKSITSELRRVQEKNRWRRDPVEECGVVWYGLDCLAGCPSGTEDFSLPRWSLAQRSEDEEEDEDNTEPKAGLESDQKEDEENKDTKEGHPRELTEEEKQQVLHSEEFVIFFDRSIRVMERALAEDSNIFFDYSGRDLEDKEGDLQGGSILSFNRLFYDEHWSKHRVITCLDWSPQYPELLVASYNNNEDAPHEPDGVALVWNMKFKKTTPEYIYHCQVNTTPTLQVSQSSVHFGTFLHWFWTGHGLFLNDFCWVQDWLCCVALWSGVVGLSPLSTALLGPSLWRLSSNITWPSQVGCH
ncbi:cytoplasmic dynein 1 intermediate chain 1 isoform X1 [Tachysurus ichikawai]